MFDILETLFGELFSPFIPFLQAVKSYVPFILIGLVAVACGIRFGTPLVLGFSRRLVTRTPRHLFKAKSTLLAQPDICEMYAPANQYITDREEGKKGGSQFAWLSPFPRAVKASIKRNPVSRNRKLNARAQVAAAAKCITVRAPHPADNVAGDLEEHYRIDMKLDGHDRKEIENLEGRIKAQLGLRETQRINTKDNYTMSWIAHKTEPEDPLVSQKYGSELFKDNPAKSPSALPCAVTQSGNIFTLPMHHTLVFAGTGGGKGSVIHAMILQLLPFWEQDRVKFYGIDPKMSELKAYRETSVFEAVEQDTDQAQETISEVYDLMNQRSRSTKIDVEKGDLKRSLDATTETPMIVLVIDELLDLLLSLKTLGKPGAATAAQLTGILAKGRSLGIYVVAATQSADKELLGRMRVNFANVIVLRQDSVYLNDMFLGEKAAERGFDSTAIPASNKANGYKYAGIGFSKQETGDPVKVRFAYTSDDDLIEVIKNYPKHDDFDSFDGLGSLPQPREDDEVEQEHDELPDLDSLPDLHDDEEAKV